MTTNYLKPNCNGYDFLRLLVSSMIIQKQDVFLKKHDLEKSLYNYYNNPNYKALFKNILKREGMDYDYVDLEKAFETAYTYGLLKVVQTPSDTKCIINISNNQAMSICYDYDPKEIYLMSELCRELHDEKEERKVYTLTNARSLRKVK